MKAKIIFENMFLRGGTRKNSPGVSPFPLWIKQPWADGSHLHKPAL